MSACMQPNVFMIRDIWLCSTCEEREHMMILSCPGSGLSGKSNGWFPGKLPHSSISPCDEPARQSVRGGARLYTSAQSQSCAEHTPHALSPRSLSSSVSPRCALRHFDPAINGGAPPAHLPAFESNLHCGDYGTALELPMPSHMQQSATPEGSGDRACDERVPSSYSSLARDLLVEPSQCRRVQHSHS
jgi:hypothetical protein